MTTEERQRKDLLRIQKFVALAHPDSGVSDAERENFRYQADKLIARLGLAWSDFDYVNAAPAPEPTRPPRVRKSCREPASGKASPEPKASPEASPDAAPEPKPAPAPKAQPGSKGRRDWTASALKLARQEVWDNLTTDEIVAHRQRLDRTGSSSRAVAQAAWAQTVKDGIASGSLAFVSTDMTDTILRWASYDFGKAA